MESAAKRAELPIYKIIPAAQDSELTPAMTSETNYRNWARSQGDSANTRYSALSQINRGTVSQLDVAWVYHSGDGAGNIQANPVIVDGVMYVPTVGKNIVAIDAAIGKELWRFHPEAEPAGAIELGYGPAHRGLTYWSGDASFVPRLFFIANGYLVALQAKTGTPVKTFGDGGRVASSKGPGKSSFLGSVAPAIYENVIVAPNQNVVDAFDVRVGRKLWSFDTLTYPVADRSADNGGNIWGGIAMDKIRGIVFLAVGDPHPDSFVGIDRPGNNEHADSVVALNAKSGHLLWSFQAIAHDIWDLDISAPPNLVTVTIRGKRVDAVAQVTKLGITLLLDRVTGKPLFPYRLRRAPVSTLPGERTAAYQPAPELPEAFARQQFSLDDLSDISAETQAFLRKQAQGTQSGWFLPLSLEKPTILYGIHGGAEWPGAAFDPATGWLYVSANQVPWIQSLTRIESSTSEARNHLPGAVDYQRNCAMCHGADRQGQGTNPPLSAVNQHLSREAVSMIVAKGRNAMPALGLPEKTQQDIIEFLFAAATLVPSEVETTYASAGFDRFLDEEGYPGSKPPWGTLNALDLNTGRLMWQVPLGEYDELARRGIPRTGTENFGGATVTAGGLVFCAGTRDGKIRAFDKTTGRELWQRKLPHGGYAPPSTYEVNGRQFVVIAATGGGKLGGETGDAYVAFALPDRSSKAD